MPTVDELRQDKDFMSASPADQQRYLQDVDKDFAGASTEDKTAYMEHLRGGVTAQAVAGQPPQEPKEPTLLTKAKTEAVEAYHHPGQFAAGIAKAIPPAALSVMPQPGTFEVPPKPVLETRPWYKRMLEPIPAGYKPVTATPSEAVTKKIIEPAMEPTTPAETAGYQVGTAASLIEPTVAGLRTAGNIMRVLRGGLEQVPIAAEDIARARQAKALETVPTPRTVPEPQVAGLGRIPVAPAEVVEPVTPSKSVPKLLTTGTPEGVAVPEPVVREMKPVIQSEALRTVPTPVREPEPQAAALKRLKAPERAITPEVVAEAKAAREPEAAKPVEVGGTKEGAERDTALFQQARKELGPDASMSDVAKRAQELKTGKIPTVERREAPERRVRAEGLPEGVAEERRVTERRAPMSSVELEKAIREGKPVQTPFDVTEGARETIAREVPKTPAEEAKLFDESKKHMQEGKDYAILTAENPQNKTLSTTENASRNITLLNTLRERGYDPIPVKGQYAGNVENAFFVKGMNPEEAVGLGKQRGQQSVLTSKGLHDLNTGKINLSDHSKMLFDAEARKQDAFFTMHGRDFHIPIDFERPIKSPVKETKIETPTGPEGLTDSQKRAYEYRLGKDTAADVTKEGIERNMRLLKARNSELTKFANDNNVPHPDGPGVKWSDSDFSKPTGSKYLSPKKEALFNWVRQNMPHEDFMKQSQTWGVSKELQAEAPKMEAAVQVAKEKGIPEYLAKKMTSEEIAGVEKEKNGVDKMLARLEKQPEVQQFIDIALQGEAGRKWYQRSSQAIEAVTKVFPDYFKEVGDKEKFMGVLGSTSPQQSVAMNLREALSFWKDWVDSGRLKLNLDKWIEYVQRAGEAWSEAGKPENMTRFNFAPRGKQWAQQRWIEQRLTNVIAKAPNLIKALNGEDLWPDLSKNENFKVPSFVENLRGNLKAATHDTWMGLFGDVTREELKKPSSYHPMSVSTRLAAEALGWEPAEAQAAIWSFTQALRNLRESGYGVESVTPEAVRLYNQDFADIIGNDPQVRGILKEFGATDEQLTELQRHLETGITPKPEVTGRTTPTTPYSVRKLEERIEARRAAGKLPESKFGQESLFREPPARESRNIPREPEEVRFEPSELEAEAPATEEQLKARNEARSAENKFIDALHELGHWYIAKHFGAEDENAFIHLGAQNIPESLKSESTAGRVMGGTFHPKEGWVKLYMAAEGTEAKNAVMDKRNISMFGGHVVEELYGVDPKVIEKHTEGDAILIARSLQNRFSSKEEVLEKLQDYYKQAKAIIEPEYEKLQHTAKQIVGHYGSDVDVKTLNKYHGGAVREEK